MGANWKRAPAGPLRNSGRGEGRPIHGQSERTPDPATYSPVALPASERTVLDLQRYAGNRAVATLVARFKDRPGWTDASSKPGEDAREGRQTDAWNASAKDTVGGKIRRVPIDQLALGNQKAVRSDPGSKALTSESGAGRAIVLIPSALEPGGEIDAMIHFHGHTETADRPYAGWRQRTSDNTVRDLALDQLEQQLHGSGATQLIGILPQGTEFSGFGNSTFDADAYLKDVLRRLVEVKEIAPPRGQKALAAGRVMISGHSGAGKVIRAMIEGTGTAKLPGNLGELVLFDAINSGDADDPTGQYGAVRSWVFAQLGRDRAIATDPAVSEGDKRSAIARTPGFRGYHSNSRGYTRRYNDLKGEIDVWFADNRSALGTIFGDVRGKFEIRNAGVGGDHEAVMRGHARSDTSNPEEGNVTDAIRAMYGRATAPKPATAPAPMRSRGKASPPLPVPAAASPGPAATPSPAMLVPALVRGVGLAPAEMGLFMLDLVTGADPVKSAIGHLGALGVSETDLTDGLFIIAHPGLPGGRIPAGDEALAAEWREIRRSVVRPALKYRWRARPPVAAGPTAAATTSTASGMTDKQRKELVATATQQAKTGGEPEDNAAIAADIKESKTTVDAWFAGLDPGATFLGVPIKASGGSKAPGVHRELADVLLRAEGMLLKLHPGLTPSDIGTQLNVYGIVGLRRPKKATGGSRPSMHCFGMAVDINYKGNPFVGEGKVSGKAAREMIQRATLLMKGAEENIRAAPEELAEGGKKDTEAGRQMRAERAGRLWERFTSQSAAFKAYLNLTDAELADRVAANGGGYDLAWWKERLTKDRSFSKTGNFAKHSDPAKAGFMDLPKELVRILVEAGLTWGGAYNTAKDLMHFDLRTGTIKGRQVA